MRVVFSSAALADLEEIGDYIARDNARRALSFVRDLRARAQEIASMPLAFPLVPLHELHGIRRRPFGQYLIFYHVTDDRIAIVRVVHGMRQYEVLLFPEGG